MIWTDDTGKTEPRNGRNRYGAGTESGNRPGHEVARRSGNGPGGDGGGLISNSARIAVASALSRVSGLLRIVLIASVLGSTVLGDLFVAINVLPLTLYDVFAGSAISSVLVPPLVRRLDRGDGYGARRLAANALGLIVVVMAGVAVIAVLGRGLIGAALTSGVEPELTADARSVAALLLLLIVPQLVLYAAIGVMVSIQHAHHRFLLPSAAPIVENVGLLATVGVVWYRFGTGWEVDNAPRNMILMLAVGSCLSVGSHALLQFVGAWRAAGSISIGLDGGDPEVRALVGPARESFGWSSVIAVRQFALVIAAGFAGAGGVQAFEIAMLAYFVPVALIGRPVASAALPSLSRHTGGTAPLLRGYLGALRLASWLAVPAGVSLVLLGQPLAELVARGRFNTPDAIRMVTFGLIGLGVGAAAEALFEVARQTIMAQGDGRALRRSTAVRALTAIVGLPAVVVLFDGAAVLLGLGLVVSVGDLGAFLIAHRTLRRDPDWPVPYVVHWPRIVAATALGIVPAAILAAVSPIGGEARTLLVLAVVVATFGCAAFAASERGRMIRALSDSLTPTATSLRPSTSRTSASTPTRGTNR